MAAADPLSGDVTDSCVAPILILIWPVCLSASDVRLYLLWLLFAIDAMRMILSIELLVQQLILVVESRLLHRCDGLVFSQLKPVYVRSGRVISCTFFRQGRCPSFDSCRGVWSSSHGLCSLGPSYTPGILVEARWRWPYMHLFRAHRSAASCVGMSGRFGC